MGAEGFERWVEAPKGEAVSMFFNEPLEEGQPYRLGTLKCLATDGNSYVTFKPTDKSKVFVVLLLGLEPKVSNLENGLQPDRALNDFGWFFQSDIEKAVEEHAPGLWPKIWLTLRSLAEKSLSSET
jgi:hypothetical protein